MLEKLEMHLVREMPRIWHFDTISGPESLIDVYGERKNSRGCVLWRYNLNANLHTHLSIIWCIPDVHIGFFFPPQWSRNTHMLELLKLNLVKGMSWIQLFEEFKDDLILASFPLPSLAFYESM